MSIRWLLKLIVSACITFTVVAVVAQWYARDEAAANNIAAASFDLPELSRLDSRDFETKLVTGAPFFALLTVEHPKRFPDGTTTTQTAVSMIYRDSKGRTRLEQLTQAQGVQAAVPSSLISITLNDSVAGFSYVMDPRTNIARRSEFMPQPLPGSKESAAQSDSVALPKPQLQNSQILPVPASSDKSLRRAAGNSPSNVKQESIGFQQIEGLTAEGTRITMTIPAGTMKNAKPIEIMADRWYSSTLQTVILIEQTDSRVGKSIYRLSDIKTGEPSSSLFVVPSDYKIRQ